MNKPRRRTIFQLKSDKRFRRVQNISDVIVANRQSDKLSDVEDKVYTRDILGMIKNNGER